MPARLIEYLSVSGARDTTGAAVSNGTVNFYQPNTMTPVAVYSDDAATLTITQPITLDAGGRTTCYAIAPVRLIVKDVNGVTVQDIARADGDRAELVWQTATGWTASSVKSALEALATSLGGTDGKVRPTGGSADQYIKDWAGNFWINVKSRGAVGDGVSDDTSAIQGAIDYLAGLTPAGGVVYFPPGIYLTTGLTVGVTSGTPASYAIVLKGAGARATTIKLTSGSADAVTATDADNFVLEDIGFSHSSTTTGAAVKLLGCQFAHVNRVYVPVAKFATGVDVRSNATSSRAIVDVCISNSVLNTVSDNANAAVRIGRSTAVANCQGVTVRDCSLGRSDTNGYAVQIEGEVYGILLSGNRIQKGVYVADGTGGTTAFSGFGISLIGNQLFSVTVTLAPAAAIGFAEYGNSYTSAVSILDSSHGAVWGSSQLARRPVGFTGTQSAGSGGTFTPDLSKGATFLLTITGGTTTIANPTNATSKTRGTSFVIICAVSGVDQVVAFDTEYKAAAISGQPANGTTAMLLVVFDGTNWRPTWFGSTTT